MVDRVGDEPCQEEYLAISMVRPRSSMEAAHRQRRVVQYGDDDVVVVLGRRRHGGGGEVAEAAVWNLPFASAPSLSLRSDRV